jgi:hypothetical protein
MTVVASILVKIPFTDHMETTNVSPSKGLEALCGHTSVIGSLFGMSSKSRMLLCTT